MSHKINNLVAHLFNNQYLLSTASVDKYIYIFFFSTCAKVALIPLKIPKPINHFEVVNIPKDKQITKVAVLIFMKYKIKKLAYSASLKIII